MSPRLLLLELNEVNFEYVLQYCRRGSLPNLERLIRRSGIARTVSESKYEELEPWIQWVTAHTGKTLAEHKVFRLGDIVNHDLTQIWEELENAGLRVGAISPMNAKNRLKQAAFFVPDPWTETRLTAPPRLERLYDAVVQAVNDNAQSRLTPYSAVQLLLGLCKYSRPSNYSKYLHLAFTSVSSPWRRAMVLDLLFADVFIKEIRRTRPDFATLFLNAAAHIQHHYLFSSPCYSGKMRNPPWYLPPGVDPLGEVYAAYDRILGEVSREFPGARIMVATGLHQDPHENVTFYWRLRDHAKFLRRIGVSFDAVEPRMSRDFLVKCRTHEEAAAAEHRLSTANGADGVPLFEVDNRGSDLFVMLTYPRDIPADFIFAIGEQTYTGLRNDVAFVALKNGQHNGIGYFLDSGTEHTLDGIEFPLRDLPSRILHVFGLSAQQDNRAGCERGVHAAAS